MLTPAAHTVPSCFTTNECPDASDKVPNIAESSNTHIAMIKIFFVFVIVHSDKNLLPKSKDNQRRNRAKRQSFSIDEGRISDISIKNNVVFKNEVGS